MWIITDLGFVSVVEHESDSELLLVRGRRVEDVQAVSPDDAVVDMPSADYRYRMTVSREAFAEWLVDRVVGLDYTTHAKEYMCTDEGGARDADRYDAYLDVWTALASLQPTPPYSGAAPDLRLVTRMLLDECDECGLVKGHTISCKRDRIIDHDDPILRYEGLEYDEL